MNRRRFLKTAGAGAASLFAPGRGWALPRPAAARADCPNVLLIVLDTLRADHTTLHGYGRPTTPNLESFAAGATLYPRSFASAPWTLPTHASFFTGLQSLEHGADTRKKQEPTTIEVPPLGEGNLTLAEVLRGEGYATAGLSANWGWLAPAFGVGQGFQTYAAVNRAAPQQTDVAIEWLEKRAPGPFFLFLNYIDAHHPYQPSKRDEFPTPAGDPEAMHQRLCEKVMFSDEPLPQREIQDFVDLYDNAVANLDEHVGRLFARLGQMRLFDKSLIVIVSDHGECFGEHRLIEHDKELYQEELWVPLIIKKPGQTTTKIDTAVVSSVDIPHMILENLPQDIGERTLPLFPRRPGNHPVIAEHSFLAFPGALEWPWKRPFNRVRTALIDWPHKYIHSSDGLHELYNLQTDPHEAVNLVQSDAETARRLAAVIVEWQSKAKKRVGEANPANVDDNARKGLKALGYL